MNDFIAGSIGGVAGVFAGHPFDTVKVQVQTQEFGGKFTNLSEAFKTVKRQNLAKGFFRGLSWPLLSYGAINAVFFGGYGLAFNKLNYGEDPDKPPNYFVIATAAAAGTLPSMGFLCPVEVIKITLQSQISHGEGVSPPRQKFYKGPIEACKSILKTSGVKGLYRGCLTLTLRDIPANIVYMTYYALFQYECGRMFPSIPSQAINFVGGGLAGVISWTLIMPFDVVKSKLQVDSAKLVYKGFWDCARKVYVSDGLKGFFLGYVAVTLRAFPVNAITLMFYSESLLYLNKQKQ